MRWRPLLATVHEISLLTLADIAKNESADELMLELVTARARELGTPFDLNYQQRAKTLKWKIIDKAFQHIVRLGISSSDLTM